MITEDYVSRETYKLLKEKGYDGEFKTCHDIEGYTYTAIHLYDAMKWLREMCKCYIHIAPFYPHGNYSEPPKWLVAVDANYVPYPTMKNNFETYEEAAESAIKYSLKNLI